MSYYLSTKYHSILALALSSTHPKLETTLTSI